MTDTEILTIAAEYRNHTLTAQSGRLFDVIEHADLVRFAREIERRAKAAGVCVGHGGRTP
ncbi:hypothetical protein AGR2A_Cc120081 [Agrobacterium genomosp. 2 str. CFBP 5494]|uniref:Uncharacterized protein n=1 Tax=Agrobacterium genomosp. 2 str. CFBP 5494 TaxID=1183436 RepID=A0A9W5AYY7_9HYPH|nr:hypothetical protein AGR2A_Cc120081 [Agrobacterium genomosp. 2 str. CFBP 5494]